MKTKPLLLGISALIAAAGLWVGRTVWRAHHQLVTLNVREIPLAEVLRKIERQTGTKIRAEKALDARITLHLTDKPLSDVLDRIAEQAGAHWSTVYAVYDSAHALASLESALRSDGKLEPADWTKIAPNAHTLMSPEAAGNGPRVQLRANPDGSPMAGGESQSFAGSEGRAPAFPPAGDSPHWLGNGPPPELPGPMPGKGGTFMFRGSATGGAIMQNGKGQIEEWSPQELVIESNLNVRLGDEHIDTATAAAAKETAQKVKGQWTTYLAFRKSIMGIGFARPPRPGFDPLRGGQNDRFARLTAEQRVLRAREHLDHESKTPEE